MTTPHRLALLPLLALLACKEPAPPPVEAAEEAVEAEPPRPPAPVPVPVEVVALTPDQRRIELLPAGITRGVPASAHLELTSVRALTDVRVRLFDPSDDLVASDDELAVGQGTRYLLRPREGLEPGVTYRLRIDGARGAQPADVEGNLYLVRELTFETATENGAEAGASGG